MSRPIEHITEDIGQLVDKCDNFLVYASGGGLASLSADIRIDALKIGLEEIREKLDALFLELGGER